MEEFLKEYYKTRDIKVGDRVKFLTHKFREDKDVAQEGVIIGLNLFDVSAFLKMRETENLTSEEAHLLFTSLVSYDVLVAETEDTKEILNLNHSSIISVLGKYVRKDDTFHYEPVA